MMLRRRIIFPAAAIALILSLVLTGLGILAGHVIVSTMANQLIGQMTKAVRYRADDMITFGDRMSTRMVNDIARHDIPFSDPVALRRQLYGQTIDEPNLQWLACGNEAGGMTDAGRLADGTLVFLMTDDFRAGVYREYAASPDGQLGSLRRSGVYFDTREQPWYRTVRDTRSRYWTEPILGKVDPTLGVALSAPVINKDGSFAGVCNVLLIFTALSDFMNSIHLGDNGRGFILDGSGYLIAASGGVSPVVTVADGERQERLHASGAGDPIVRETARHLSRHPEIIEASSTEPPVFSFDDPERGKIYAAVDRIDAPGGIKWTIVSALPAMDFLRPVYQMAYLSIAISTVIAAVFLVLGLWASGRAFRPMTALTNAAQAIAKGEWRDLPEVRRNDEVGLLAQAFNLMMVRLKDTLDGLRRSEARLEEAQRIAHVGYWERDLDTDRFTWSEETYRIFELAPQEPAISFAEVQKLIHPEDRRVVIQAVTEALRGGPRYDVEYRVARPNGELRIVHSQGDVTRDESGRPHRMFGTIQDITERKQAAEALREAQMELARVNRVTTMGQLTASIAHEVNQPIAATVTNAQAALRWVDMEPPDLAEVRCTLDRIIRDGNRAGEVISRIREQIKKAPPRRDAIDINETIRDVIGLARGEITRNGILVETQFGDDLPLVHGDQVQLQQVILNLIVNATEAMGSVFDGLRELRIRTSRDDTDGVCVAVFDSGPGLAPEALQRIFEAFYTTKPGGMGMGLPICRSIIEAHGGQIWAAAKEPRGAVFQFTLPPGRAETAPAEHFG